MVGLSTAWPLQELGVDVTVVDRTGVAAGSSWGNAGWLTPSKAIPLADPSLWSYGPTALFDVNAALHVPLRFDTGPWSFLARFASHGTQRSWDRTMAKLTPIDRIALDGFDELIEGGVKSWKREGPFVIGFVEEKHSVGFLHEIKGVTRHGQSVPFERLVNPRELAPQLSDRVEVAYRLDGQRFIEPGAFVHALADTVAARGGRILTGRAVSAVGGGTRPTVTLSEGERVPADSVVIATGAWLPALAREFGVNVRVQAGRGYSFTAKTAEPAEHPVYLPFQRIACTPYEGRLRIAGTMEFRGPEEPPQAQRIQEIAHQAVRLLSGVDLDERSDAWGGARDPSRQKDFRSSEPRTSRGSSSQAATACGASCSGLRRASCSPDES